MLFGINAAINAHKNKADNIAVNGYVSDTDITTQKSVETAAKAELPQDNKQADKAVITQPVPEKALSSIAYVPADFEPYEMTEDSKVTIYNNEIDKGFTMDGDKYHSGILCNTGWCDPEMLFNTKGMYTNLHFRVGHVDGSNKQNVKLYINLDGEDKQVIPVSHNSLSEEYDIDVTGVKLVKLVCDCPDFISGTYTAFTDMYFYNSESYSPVNTASTEETPAMVQAPFDFKPYEITEDNKVIIYNNDLEKVFNVSGDSYNTGFILNSNFETPTMLFNTKGMFTNLHFNVGHVDGKYKYDVKVYINLDGEYKQVFTVPYNEPSVDYDIDISNANLVSIYCKCDAIAGSYTAFTDVYFYDNTRYTPPEAEPIAYADKKVSIPDELMPFEITDDKVRIYKNELENTFVMNDNSYNNGLVLNSSREKPELNFNSKGMYKNLHFCVGHVDEKGKYDIKLHIVLDGNENQIIEVPHNALSQEFDVDISGVKHIHMYVTCDNLSGSDTGFTDMYVS